MARRQPDIDWRRRSGASRWRFRDSGIFGFAWHSTGDWPHVHRLKKIVSVVHRPSF